MSSYLTFYLVPKKSKTKYTNDGDIVVELPQEPLALFSYSRNTNIYQKYYECLNPAYAGSEDKYTELTLEDALRVIQEFKEEELIPAKNRLNTLYKIIKESYHDDLVSDILSSEEYVKELKLFLNELEQIAIFVKDIYNGYGDFEKVLININ